MNNGIEYSKFNLSDITNTYLTLPEKSARQDRALPKKLGDFLIDRGLIKSIGINQGWGFSYHSGTKTIKISQDPMSKKSYEYYVFRLGKNSNTGKNIFPNAEEMDQYRFLHETSHAYQQFLIEKESPDNISKWYDRAGLGEIDSIFSILYSFCLNKRLHGQGAGLSTYGNVPDYDSIEHNLSQQATRAIEDSNELVTMYLWSPEYFDTFLEYLSENIPGYGIADLEKDQLVRISNNEKQCIKDTISMYIEEMKSFLDGTDNVTISENIHKQLTRIYQ